MMKTYLCTNIEYDTDGEDVFPPNELTIVLEEVDDDTSEDVIEERLADVISDHTGWCVMSFEVEEVLSTTAEDLVN